MILSFPFRVALAFAGAVLLASCSNKIVPPCPSVRVDSNTARFVKFQKDEVHDLTQVAFSIDLVGYQGQCVYNKQGVDVLLDLTFDVTAGPAVTAGTLEIPYFVALPQFYGKPYGKRVMNVTAKLPAKPGLRQRVEEHGVHVNIPLKRDEPGAAYDVYVGLQIGDDDADYNRERRARELEAVRNSK